MAEPAAPEHGRTPPWLALAVAVLTAVAWAWLAAMAGSVWLTLEPAARAGLRDLLAPAAGVIFLFALLLPAALALLLRPWVGRWPRAARRLREEVAIVSAANAGHRITVQGHGEMRALAQAVATLAQRHALQTTEVQARIDQARDQLAEESRRLAALMSQLPQGVLVASHDDRIVLYNARAELLLARSDLGPVGLGRALGGVLDGKALAHARRLLERRLAARRAGATGSATAVFVTAQRAASPRVRAGDAPPALPEVTLLRVLLVPVAAEAGRAGLVLLIDDITRGVLEQGRRDALLHRLTEGTRAALGSLRAAAQALQQYPQMEAAQRTRFTTVVHDEAERLAAQLAQVLAEPGAGGTGGWPLEQLHTHDLLHALAQGLGAAAPALQLSEGPEPRGAWLEVDSHAIVQLMVHLLSRLSRELGVSQVRCAVDAQARFVRFDFEWTGPALEAARLQEWESARLAIGEAAGADTRAVLDRHGGELWVVPARAGAAHRLSVQLPASTEDADEDDDHVLAGGRPIAYDFDLFHQAGQTEALDATPLAALTCTVFDTETTGLRPSEGDEIIAIGAVRIVNARLLEHEGFACLTRPRRPVRASALAIHGISDERLASEPALEAVLPRFARFCEGTVLVAHNAAFDMRFLELARERTGVRFDQPVLDTLLLAAAVQPAHGAGEHHLEQIAARLGVPVTARHEALADAEVTARVFLKLVPLLAERGIVTLGQARAASMATAQAREAF